MAKKNTGDKTGAPGTVIPVEEAPAEAKATVKKHKIEVGTRVLYLERVDRGDEITCEAKIVELDTSGQKPVAKLEVQHPYGVRLVNGVAMGGPGELYSWWLPETAA